MLVRLLRTHLGPYRTDIAYVIVLQFLGTIATLYLPTLNADIIDHGVVTGDTGYIVRVGAVMLGVTLVQIACSVAAIYYAARTASALGRGVRAAIFARVVTDFSSREVGRFGAPSLITRTTNDVQQVQTVVLLTLSLMVAAPMMGLGSVILALRQDVPLSGLLLLVVPVLLGIIGAVIVRIRPLFRTIQARIDTLNRIVREQLSGIRVIRAFVRDRHEVDRYGVANTELADVALSAGRLMAFIAPTILLVVNLSMVGALWLAAGRIERGAMPVGALVAFLAYLSQIVLSLTQATVMFVMLPRAEVCAERIMEVLDTSSSVAPPAAPVTTVDRHGTLELRGVEFGYPGAEEPVLRGVDLIARPGQTTAIVGGTGSGKTTLVNLVPRLFDVTAGAVLVDGVDVRDLDPDLLSAMVAIVPQRPYLFTGTVASNLRHGRADATDDELWHALEVAQAREFVQQMPGGLDAPIAQGGANVSGGQRQRLAIARALVRRPEIYLFDDAFSALDYATDAALRAALAAHTRHATVVIVAQRMATIRDADRIVVLDEGTVVGTGTHEELLAGNETYREIVLSQTTSNQAAP